MDKPVSLSMKDWLIRNISGKLMTSERIIEAVVNTQFDQAWDAMKTENTIEFSGFGKLVFNKRRAVKKLERYYAIKEAYEKHLAEELTDQKRKTLDIKLNSVTRDIELLKPRVNGN